MGPRTLQKQKLLDELYARVMNVLGNYNRIREGTKHVLSSAPISESMVELNEILKSDADAAGKIVGCAAEIEGVLADPSVSDEIRQAVSAHVMTIYESCGFQDISGQRIKKVLGHLESIRRHLEQLQGSAATFDGPEKNDATGEENTTLLHGPALANDVPTQEEIDRIFASL